MTWQWKIACVEILFLAGMWNSMTWAHDNSIVEEMLEVLRANGQITHQQYQQFMGKAKVSQPASPATEKPASPKATVGYQPGRGFQFESADGKHTLAIGGRIQTRWGYTDRDGGAS